jgi:RsiW-degrading membrane proteinase PrsW (M82 family)
MGSLSFPKILVIIVFAIPLFIINVALMIGSIFAMIAINKTNKNKTTDETDDVADEEITDVADEEGTNETPVQENFTQTNDIKNKTWFYLIPIFLSITGILASVCLIILINQIPSNTQWKKHVMEEYVKIKTDTTYKTDLETLFEKTIHVKD